MQKIMPVPNPPQKAVLKDNTASRFMIKASRIPHEAGCILRTVAYIAAAVGAQYHDATAHVGGYPSRYSLAVTAAK